jgi:tetratricopeptide (TPR) repeat protein
MMNSMKRLRIAGLLCAALLVFVMSGAAQTKDDVVNAYNAGAVAYKANDFAGAIASFQKVIDLGTKVGADADSLRMKCEKIISNLQLKLAVSVYQNKASSSADVIDAFQKAKDMADKYHDAGTTAQVVGLMPKIYNSMALTAFKANDLPGALANFEKVIALDPNNTSAYFNKAIIYKKQNAFDPLVLTLTKTIEIATKTSDTATIRKSKQMLEAEYMTLATAAYQKADYKGALVPLEEVFKYDDKNTNAYYVLADCKNKLKEYDAALEAVTKGLQFENPANKELVARFYLQQGVAYAAKGEKDKAVASFKLASVGKYIPTAAAYIKGLTAKPVAAPVKK